MEKVCVIGLGYIGLPTAAIIANKGIKVIGFDINENLLSSINKGEVSEEEPNLKKLVKKVLNNQNLVTSNCLKKADVYIIAVPTPLKKSNTNEPSADMEYVYGVAKEIANIIEPGNMVIIESTSSIGTTNKVAELIEKYSKISKNKFDFVCCPERVIPGNIMYEIINNDRIVGGLNGKSSKRGAKFYSYFCEGKIYQTTSETAELAKLTENAYRDVNIAFSNEMSIICDKLNVKVEELIKLTNCHPRVNLLTPGCGVGGHCIAVDPYFIASQFPNDSDLIKASRKVNENKKIWSLNKIKKVESDFKKKYNKKPTLGCLGLTYKQNVSDIRNSPSLDIVKLLIEDNYDLLICEPNLKNYKELPLTDCDKLILNSDIIIFFVGHKEFIPYAKELSENKKYIDFCGIMNPDFI